MESKHLPDNFKLLFWSQDYLSLDLIKDKKIIIVNTINYGDLANWKWIKNFYGIDGIKQTIAKLSSTELRERVRTLVKLIFSIDNFNDAPRSTNY